MTVGQAFAAIETLNTLAITSMSGKDALALATLAVELDTLLKPAVKARENLLAPIREADGTVSPVKLKELEPELDAVLDVEITVQNRIFREILERSTLTPRGAAALLPFLKED